MIGQQFNKLTVTSFLGVDKHQKKIWECRCECGVTTRGTTSAIRNGYKQSCGCILKMDPARLSHGHRRGPDASGKQSRAYNAWINLRQRCDNENTNGYENYGGRGITYDPAWSDFPTFLADMGEPPPRKSLDRIDNDGHYCKENCQWATRREQSLNRRNNRRVEFGGEALTVTEWAERLGIKPMTLLTRLDRSWPLERALTAGTFHRHGKFTPVG